jgi:hypothetical protein
MVAYPTFAAKQGRTSRPSPVEQKRRARRPSHSSFFCVSCVKLSLLTGLSHNRPDKECDEQELHRCAKPQTSYGATGQLHIGFGCMHIGWEHGD